jgi:adenylate cyclase, class 2
MKIRQINDARVAELITYDRPNDPSARNSRYTVQQIDNVHTTMTLLGGIHGVLVVVRKQRELHIWQNVRIHLDEVDGLGTFIEFEGVVTADADADISRKRVEQLVNEFGIKPADQIGLSYSDLLMVKEKRMFTTENTESTEEK